MRGKKAGYLEEARPWQGRKPALFIPSLGSGFFIKVLQVREISSCVHSHIGYGTEMQAVGSKQGWGGAAQVIFGPDPQLALYGEAVVWFHKVELFRREEEARMYRQTPTPEDSAVHKGLLLRLIADGEHLVRLIEQHGFLPNSENISAEDLGATLQNLRADYRGWYEPMPAAQQAQILREVFDVPKPAH